MEKPQSSTSGSEPGPEPRTSPFQLTFSPQHSVRHTNFPDQPGKFRMKAFNHILPQEHRASSGVWAPRSFLNEEDDLRPHCPSPLCPPPAWAQLGPCRGAEETLGSICFQAATGAAPEAGPQPQGYRVPAVLGLSSSHRHLAPPPQPPSGPRLLPGARQSV